MDAQTSSAQTTLAIILGASQWPDSPEFPSSAAFTNAVTGFKDYLFNQNRFGLPNENILDLFDAEDSPHIIDKRMRQFLEHRTREMQQGGNPAKDLLVYFVGHGGFGRNTDYYLAVRCTSTENLRISGLPIESLASTLTDKARYLRRMIILDCCYAAAAFTAFQTEGPAKLGINQTFWAFEKQAKTVGKGTALLCSSGKTVASQIAPDGSCTMFSKALIQALFMGRRDRREQHYLSLREVADLTEEIIDTVLEGKAPRPEIHSPDQREGDVANVPFFPNSAALSPANRVTPTSQALLAVIPTYPSDTSSPPTRGAAPPTESQLLQPSSRRISRRVIAGGLVGLAIVSIAGGGIALLAVAREPPLLSSHTMPPSQHLPIPLGTRLYIYRGHSIAHLTTSNAVRGVTWSPNSKRIASAGWDMTVQVWDAADGGNGFIYKRHTNAVYTVAWSPNGKRIASAGYDQTVQVWDAVDGGNVYVYSGHSSVVRAVAWSHDGKRIASGDEKTVQVWDAADGGNVYTYRGHTDQVFMVAWSPDGRRIASASSDKTVQVWDATNGGNVYTYRGHMKGLYAVAWSPGGRRIASASSDKTVQVWDATNGGHVYTYRGHGDAVVDVAWSPDDTRIASGSDDRTVQVWNATNGGDTYTYQGHTNAVYTVAWAPDGSRIASAGEDSTVQVWGAG